FFRGPLCTWLRRLLFPGLFAHECPLCSPDSGQEFKLAFAGLARRGGSAGDLLKILLVDELLVAAATVTRLGGRLRVRIHLPLRLVVSPWFAHALSLFLSIELIEYRLFDVYAGSTCQAAGHALERVLIEEFLVFRAF